MRALTYVALVTVAATVIATSANAMILLVAAGGGGGAASYGANAGAPGVAGVVGYDAGGAGGVLYGSGTYYNVGAAGGGGAGAGGVNHLGVIIKGDGVAGASDSSLLAGNLMGGGGGTSAPSFAGGSGGTPPYQAGGNGGYGGGGGGGTGDALLLSPDGKLATISGGGGGGGYSGGAGGSGAYLPLVEQSDGSYQPVFTGGTGGAGGGSYSAHGGLTAPGVNGRNHSLGALGQNGLVSISLGGLPSDPHMTLNYTGSLQTLIIPQSGLYTFSVYGTQGGGGVDASGGYGAEVITDLQLVQGSLLDVIVGGAGSSDQFNLPEYYGGPLLTLAGGGGGGGGTFIYLAGLVTPSAVPEPSSWGLMLLGLGIAGACLRTPARLNRGLKPDLSQTGDTHGIRLAQR